MTAPAFRVCDPFPRTVTCIDAKRTSMLIHTAIKNGNIPPVRAVTGLPGAMSGCGATCTLRGLPGVVVSEAQTANAHGISGLRARLRTAVAVSAQGTRPQVVNSLPSRMLLRNSPGFQSEYTSAYKFTCIDLCMSVHVRKLTLVSTCPGIRT